MSGSFIYFDLTTTATLLCIPEGDVKGFHFSVFKSSDKICLSPKKQFFCKFVELTKYDYIMNFN